MIVTNVGRPLARCPLFMSKGEDGEYLLVLSRVDVSDVGNELRVDVFYAPLLVVQHDDQMTTVEFRIGKYVLVVFISPKKVDWHVIKPDQETE